MREYLQSFKEKYNSHEPIYREYKFYRYRIRVGLYCWVFALIFFVADLIIFNEAHGWIYWINMLLFFVLLVAGFCVMLSMEIKTIEYRDGTLYRYEYTILGFIPRLSSKEKNKDVQSVKSEFKTIESQRERNKD